MARTAPFSPVGARSAGWLTHSRIGKTLRANNTTLNYNGKGVQASGANTVARITNTDGLPTSTATKE